MLFPAKPGLASKEKLIIALVLFGKINKVATAIIRVKILLIQSSLIVV
jgi:hypothetical protein